MSEAGRRTPGPAATGRPRHCSSATACTSCSPPARPAGAPTSRSTPPPSPAAGAACATSATPPPTAPRPRSCCPSRAAGGPYETLAARHSGKCADVRDQSPKEGAEVVQYDCTGGVNQQWRRAAWAAAGPTPGRDGATVRSRRPVRLRDGAGRDGGVSGASAWPRSAAGGGSR
ncbi:RICIN domain-containing protein [Streptomyces carminius]|uniref:RICIN domain-containing protein n=1 Tax=Streptomyces carminius TaxID=2665496 RepID=UPI0038CD8DD2